MNPAKTQISREKFQQLHQKQETPGTIFNIWHLQESGGDSRKHHSLKTLSPCRWTSTDVGTTSAPDDLGRFCLWYSRGMCTYGSECFNLHRLPSARDESLLNPALDCFGREKHAGYRDDMRGVGSFLHENKSIVVSNLETVENLEDVVRNRFAAFGTVVDVSVAAKRYEAMITYQFESQAQFAKEAMTFQPLVKGSKRGLIVRWAKPQDTSLQDQERVQRALNAKEQNNATVLHCSSA